MTLKISTARVPGLGPANELEPANLDSLTPSQKQTVQPPAGGLSYKGPELVYDQAAEQEPAPGAWDGKPGVAPGALAPDVSEQQPAKSSMVMVEVPAEQEPLPAATDHMRADIRRAVEDGRRFVDDKHRQFRDMYGATDADGKLQFYYTATGPDGRGVMHLGKPPKLAPLRKRDDDSSGEQFKCQCCDGLTTASIVKMSVTGGLTGAGYLTALIGGFGNFPTAIDYGLTFGGIGLGTLCLFACVYSAFTMKHK